MAAPDQRKDGDDVEQHEDRKQEHKIAGLMLLDLDEGEGHLKIDRKVKSQNSKGKTTIQNSKLVFTFDFWVVVLSFDF